MPPRVLFRYNDAPSRRRNPARKPSQTEARDMGEGFVYDLPRVTRKNPAAPRYTLLGVDEEVTVCEHCGKADLKCTVVLGVLDADGNVEREARFGRSCAAKALRKPSTTTANKMESLARVAEFKRVWAMRVDGPGKHEQVAAGRFPTYVTSYLLTDGRTLLLQESDPSFRPPAGAWTRLREGAWVGHPAKTNPRRRTSTRRNPKMDSYPCSRCGGSGKLSGYSHVWGGVCFKCGGTGTQATKPSSKPIKWAVYFPKTVERPTAIERGDYFTYVVSAKTPDQAILKATTTFLGSRLVRHEFTERGAWAEPYEEYYARWEAGHDG